MSYAIYPATQFVPVTTSDTEKIKYPASIPNKNVRARALYVGTGGNLTIKDEYGNNVTFVGLIAGTLLPVSTDQVMSTGTSASNIVALLDNQVRP